LGNAQGKSHCHQPTFWPKAIGNITLGIARGTRMSAPKPVSEFTAGRRPLDHFHSDSSFCKRKERALIRAEAYATVFAHDTKNRVFLMI
jgi:hypothetical protein